MDCAKCRLNDVCNNHGKISQALVDDIRDNGTEHESDMLLTMLVLVVLGAENAEEMIEVPKDPSRNYRLN